MNEVGPLLCIIFKNEFEIEKNLNLRIKIMKVFTNEEKGGGGGTRRRGQEDGIGRWFSS